MIGRYVTLVMGAVWLTGCNWLFGQTVKQPSASVVSLLYAMPQSADVMDVPTRFPGTRMRVERDGDAISWVYSLNGKDACRFTVTVEPIGDDASTIWTKTKDISPEGQAYICATVAVAGEESVAAALAGQPANSAKVEAKLAAAAVGNMGSMQKTLGEQINQMAPKSSSCREVGNAKAEADCRQRDFNRRHDRQGN